MDYEIVTEVPPKKLPSKFANDIEIIKKELASNPKNILKLPRNNELAVAIRNSSEELIVLMRRESMYVRKNGEVK